MTVYLCCVKVCDHRACISSRVKDRRGHCLCWMSKSWTTSCCEDHTYMWTEATSYCCCYKGRTAGTVVRDELLLPARGDGQARRKGISYYSRTLISLHDNLSEKISLQIYPFCACISLQQQFIRENRNSRRLSGISLLLPFLPASFCVLFRLVLFSMYVPCWKIV